ncbi:hypothetical protein Bca4012_062912 [Brassica carinata]
MCFLSLYILNSLPLHLCKESSVSLSVFDGIVKLLLDDKLEASGIEPEVVIATSINPKIGGF